MCQRLNETESTARGSVEGVFVMFHLFKQATPMCRTSFEGQKFRRQAHQLCSSATSEEAPCQPHNDPERGAHFVDRRKFQGNGWLENFCFVTIWSHAAQRRLVRRSRRSRLRRSLITYCSSSRGVAPPTIHTSMLPTKLPSTWIT